MLPGGTTSKPSNRNFVSNRFVSPLLRYQLVRQNRKIKFRYETSSITVRSNIPHTREYTRRSMTYIYTSAKIGALHAPFFLLGCAKRRLYMVSTEIVLIFSVGLRHAKILYGIHGDSCACDSIEWKDCRCRPILIEAVSQVWKAEDVEWEACRFS